MNTLYKKISKLFLVGVLLVGGRAVSSESGGCTTLLFPTMRQLPHTLTQEEFKVWYATDGPHALANQEDSDGNGIPDQIDNLLTQLMAARAFYSSVLQLTPPLNQPRYTQVSVINVYVRSMSKGNGLAFHEVVQDQASYDAVPEPCGLRLYVSNRLDSSQNATPAHELFHLYQYGYAMFKRSWYLEGLARLMETAFTGSEKLRYTLDQLTDIPDCLSVSSLSYSAVHYWWGLGQRAGHSPVEIPPSLMQFRYVNGSPVFASNQFLFGFLIGEVLEALGGLSRETAKQVGMALYRWPTSMQGSAQFTAAMCEVIEQLVSSHGTP